MRSIPESKRPLRKAFTLPEILIAMSLSSMIGAAIISSFMFISKSTMGLINYADMTNESRQALELFGRDVRMTRNVMHLSDGELRVELPFGVSGPEVITYKYHQTENDGAQFLNTFTRQVGNGPLRVLLTDVQTLTFTAYNLNQFETTNPNEIKQVQIHLRLLKNVLNIENTEEVLSAQFILRNKNVTN